MSGIHFDGSQPSRGFGSANNPSPGQAILNELDQLAGSLPNAPDPNSLTQSYLAGMIAAMAPFWNYAGGSAATQYQTLATDFQNFVSGHGSALTVQQDIQHMTTFPTFTSGDAQQLLLLLTAKASGIYNFTSTMALLNNTLNYNTTTSSPNLASYKAMLQGISSIIGLFNNATDPQSGNLILSYNDNYAIRVVQNDLQMYMDTLNQNGDDQQLANALNNYYKISPANPVPAPPTPSTPGAAILNEIQTILTALGSSPINNPDSSLQAYLEGLIEAMGPFWKIAGGAFNTDYEKLYTDYDAFRYSGGSFNSVSADITKLMGDGAPPLPSTKNDPNFLEALKQALSEMVSVVSTYNNANASPAFIQEFLQGMGSVIYLFTTTQRGALLDSKYINAITNAVIGNLDPYLNNPGMPIYYDNCIAALAQAMQALDS